MKEIRARSSKPKRHKMGLVVVSANQHDAYRMNANREGGKESLCDPKGKYVQLRNFQRVTWACQNKGVVREQHSESAEMPM